jgi:hypothetical protein
MGTRYRFVATAEPLQLEDGGANAIVEIDPSPEEEENGWSIRLHSSSTLVPNKREAPMYHPVAADVAGKRVRVTIEIL